MLSPRTYFQAEEVPFVLHMLSAIKQRVCFRFHALQECVSRWIKPPSTFLVLGTFADLTRSKAELLAENALLRQQLIILRRQVKRPVYRKADRVLLVFLARMVRTWKQALFIVQPETDLALASSAFPCVLETQIESPLEQAEALTGDNHVDQADGLQQSTLGAERIRGELLKLDIRVSKRTIQKYMQIHPKRARSQSWKTFLRNHAAEVWACDALAGDRPLLPSAVCLLHH